MASRQVMRLNRGQQSAKDRFLSGTQDRDHCMFVSGKAGTGKTTLIMEIVRELRAMGLNVAVTAPTGVSALNVGGETIQRFFGIVNEYFQDESTLMDRILMMTQVRERATSLDVLVIDEVSLLSKAQFEQLSRILQFLSRSDKPFGGKRVLLSGDFLQLAPVPDEQDSFYGSSLDGEAECQYAFTSTEWIRAGFKRSTVILREVVRTKEPVFMEVLSQAREGRLSAKARQVLYSRCLYERVTRGMDPKPTLRDYIAQGYICLMTTRKKVKVTNKSINKRLAGEHYRYPASDKPSTEALKDIMRRRGMRLPSVVTLATGSRVIYLINEPSLGLFNGKLGVVTGFRASRGANLPMVYFYRGNNPHSDDTPSHERLARSILIKPKTIGVRNPDGSGYLVSRTALPLRLAFCLTGHKSVSLTLDGLVIDPEPNFAKGLVYVMLSRARRMSQIVLMKPVNPEADPKPIAFYETMEIKALKVEERRARMGVPGRDPRMGGEEGEEGDEEEEEEEEGDVIMHERPPFIPKVTHQDKGKEKERDGDREREKEKEKEKEGPSSIIEELRKYPALLEEVHMSGIPIEDLGEYYSRDLDLPLRFAASGDIGRSSSTLRINLSRIREEHYDVVDGGGGDDGYEVDDLDEIMAAVPTERELAYMEVTRRLELMGILREEGIDPKGFSDSMYNRILALPALDPKRPEGLLSSFMEIISSYLESEGGDLGWDGESQSGREEEWGGRGERLDRNRDTLEREEGEEEEESLEEESNMVKGIGRTMDEEEEEEEEGY